MKEKGFTLIELLAVIVILAIIALIATPIILGIIKDSKKEANKRSVDLYGKAVELALANYMLDNAEYPTTLENLTVKYSGNEVLCNIKILNEDGSVYLSECSVKGTEVKDSSTEDGWYHYGKLKSPKNTYKSYSVGEQVKYNGIDFYVIKNSDETSDRVTMLKAEPLTVDEVNKYGIDSNGVNHVNRYVNSSAGTAYNQNGYGGMVYYSSPTCGYDGTRLVYEGCTTDYATSEVRQVVDAWAKDKFSKGALIEDITGYSSRLITIDELMNHLGYTREDGSIYISMDIENTPSWIYNSDYRYWTMSQYDTSNLSVWFVNFYGDVTYSRINEYTSYVVRPVVTILKSSIK